MKTSTRSRIDTREAHPAVSLVVRETNESLTRPLLEDACDVALATRPPSVDERLVERRLFRDELVAGVPEEHPLAERNSVSFAELAALPFAAFRAGPRSGTTVFLAMARAHAWQSPPPRPRRQDR